jgi:hypothetical protein
MSIDVCSQNGILQVTSEDAAYLERKRPIHFSALQKMIRSGQAVIIENQPAGPG